MKKRLVFFSYSLCIGGIENALVNLLNKINYDKYEVTLYLIKKEGELLSKVNSNVLIKEYKLSYSNIKPLRKLINGSKRLIFRLKNKNKYNFSCCYATYDLTCNKLAKIASSNSSIYVHSDYSNLYSSDDFKAFYDLREMDKFRKLIFVSNESRESFNRFYPELTSRSITINNFINDELILKKAEEPIDDIKRTHKYLFTFVGRLDESSKRITKLLKLIMMLHAKYDVELWIIGDGKDREHYQKIIDECNMDYVHMLGMKKNPYPYMKEADYIILTSIYEGFPVIYLESILLNKKILTTIDVTDNIISIEDNFGYILPQDIDGMYKKVDSILDNDPLNYKYIDFESLNELKMNDLEQIFDEVI